MADHHMMLALCGARQGLIKGESTIEGHLLAIDLKSWSWGMVQEVNALSHPGSKASARAMRFEKRIPAANGEDTLYRLHGNPEWNSIGRSVSSGCVRMLNQDVAELYDNVQIGTPVTVRPSRGM